MDYTDNINNGISNENIGIDKNTNTNQDKENKSISEIDVHDYDSLKEALSKSNVIINIKNNIQITDTINVTGSNIVVNGEGQTLDLNEIDSLNKKNKFIIKSNNVEISNLTFENYISSAISIYRSNNIYLKDISISGNDKSLSVDKQSLVGIDLDNSTVKLKNITSKNHRYSSIRLRKESTVELEGGNTHTDDKEEIQSIVLNGANANNVNDTTNQYTEIRESTDTNNTKNIYYNTSKCIDVYDFESLKNALLVPNSTININKDIIFDEDLNIVNKNIIINGNDKKIDLNNCKLTIKADSTILKNVEISKYLCNGLSVYRASNVSISNVKLLGNDFSLDNENRSKVGIDIYESTVSLGNITTSNHLYKGIQIRGGSTVDILEKNYHNNDSIHMQMIKADGEIDNKVNDKNGYYVHGTEKMDNNKSTIDYFSKVTINISTSKDLINNLTNSGNILYLDNDIKLENRDIPVDVDTLELIVNSNVTIEGDGHTIDLSNVATITLKGNDIVLKDLNIKNSKSIGFNIYNSRDVVLDNLNISNSTNYGIFVNGSRVKLKNCYTSNNDEGGIMITRSRTLRGNGYIDSYVEVIDSINHDEHNINVSVKNLEMIDGYFQNNKFIVPDNIYNKYENDDEYKILSDYYLDLFGIVGEERNKKYKEKSVDYMIIQKVINVQNNTEVTNEDGSFIRLIGDGIVDDTENIEKLIEYAASRGRELYFPKGTYKITRDIDLSKINLPVQSNFTITGDKDGLTIFDGSSSIDRMLKIKHEEYKSQMNYVNINNIVFNNIGIEFNGPYKKGISLNNNAFINGKYTREVNSSGNITKATMEPYIIAKNTKYSIENNIFLRNKNNPGRGISTYRTKNTTIKNNYFGNLEGISDASGMLPSDVISKLNMIKDSSNDLGLSSSQGNFFTAINNERYDEDINISNNYFNMEKTRNISSDFGEDVLVSGINVSKEGQRRDHIIYSKGYDGLNIYANYFKGMETGAAGGVKIRNGKNAYIGSNHFDDVPLLTYIYGDLTKAESLLYDTTIYNNLFHCKTNFGQEGTGILYYQSFIDGDNLTFNDGDTWTDSFGDVKNFLIYKNQFLSDDRDQITISGRAKTAYNNKQFLAYGNKYLDNNETVNYNKGNLTLSESNESDVVSKLNSGYSKYNSVAIPLTPVKSDYTYINKVIEEATLFYEDIKNKGLIGSLGGQYSETVANELKSLIEETLSLINSKSLSQYDTNKRLTLIEDTLNKLKSSINTKGDAPIITGLDKVELKIGDKFDPLSGVKATDKEDGDITKDIKVSGSVDVNVEGKYELTYTVTDSDGNKIEAKREVVVNSIKIEINNAPTIQANDKTIKVGDKFNPLDGVTAFDAEDGDITDKIKVISNNVNTNKNGNYEVVYEVIDSKGVLTSKVISVIVVSDNKPIIIGAEDIEIIEGSNFDPMEGVSAFDYEDGDITEKIIILGSVNTNKPGEYNIIYRVSDKDNNSTEFVRKVLVYDNKFNLIDNPKTGEENILVWLLTGALALIGIVLLNKKKK